VWGEGAQLELNLGIYGLKAQDLERLEQRITVGHGYKDRAGLDINRRIIMNRETISRAHQRRMRRVFI